MRKVNLLIAAALCSGCAAVPPPVQKLGNYYQQVLYVRSPRSGYRTTVDLWDRGEAGWQHVLHAPAVVGRLGVAPPGEKKEGDGRTPCGLYAVGTAFGYGPSMATGLNYRQATADDFWVDDPQAPEYNRWVRGVPHAGSFEKMRRDDHLYAMGAVIEYNTGPVLPGAGSAIFLHIWRRYDKPTAGCVAMPERYLRKVLKRLGKDRRPIIIVEAPHG